MENTLPGQVALSKAGRDAGKKFVIINVVDDNYVLIADGNLRKIEKPKKKKVKHLELTGDTIEFIREKLLNNVRVSNSDVRKSLAVQDNKPEI